jgi:hypothetical protein
MRKDKVSELIKTARQEENDKESFTAVYQKASAWNSATPQEIEMAKRVLD